MKAIFNFLWILLIPCCHIGQTKVIGKFDTPAQTRPNILLIYADDIEWWNIGVYNHGLMVPTPSLDRLAKEGMMFTDHYAAPTCIPGRAMLITGQLSIRTGFTTVGMAGSPNGLSAKYPTLAEILKPMGYRTGQFGKNHLGDLNEHVPTVLGFYKLYSNFYHLNTKEEPALLFCPMVSGINT